MNKSAAIIDSLIIHEPVVTLHPHKGGTREDGSVRLGWRERWETAKEPSMFYSVSGLAKLEGRLVRVTTSIPAVAQGVLQALGLERADKSGNTRMLSEYQAPQALRCSVKDGAFVLEESLPVSADGAECPAEYGLSFLVFTDGRKTLELKDVQVTNAGVSEKGTAFADVIALGGYDVVDAPSRGATGGPLESSGGFALPKRAVTHRAARDTRAAAPAAVDTVDVKF